MWIIGVVIYAVIAFLVIFAGIESLNTKYARFAIWNKYLVEGLAFSQKEAYSIMIATVLFFGMLWPALLVASLFNKS